jgi:PhnB protein
MTTPAGYHTLTPYLTVTDSRGLIDFIERAFDGKVEHKMERPDGTIGHASMRIGDSPLMLGQAAGEWKAFPGMLYMYVDNSDESYRRAMAAGATSIREVVDESYGDRVGAVQDPWGNQWWMATHVEVPEG